MEDIQDLSKQIGFNNLAYHYKGKNVRNNFIGFKSPLRFYRSIKEGYITLEKSEEQQKEFKLELNEMIKTIKKIENQKSVINNIKTHYKSGKKIIELFDNYSTIIFEAKYKTIHGEGLKILTPEQMLQRLPIAFAQVNQIRQIIYSLYPPKKITEKVYHNVISTINVQYKNKYYIYEF